MNRRSDLARRVIPALLFLTAFLPRLLRPVSRPLVWYLRSAHFIDAVLAADWANTIYSEHPGVGLMWPVGIGLKVYWALSGISPAAYTVPPDFEPIHFFGPVPLAEISAGIAPLALLISLGILGAWWMLRRLFDPATATVAGFLLALSPYYLTQSKVLHLDAWMATLMLLSALALLLYRRERRRRWLLISGALGGIAALVKTPAIFLFPFTGLVLVTPVPQPPSPPVTQSPSHLITQSPNHRVLQFLVPLLSWSVAAASVYVALFPTLWVDPRKGLGAVIWGIAHHASTAHDTPTFFLGRVLREDPGPIFYAVALLFRTGEVELTFLVVAAVAGTIWWVRHRRIPPKGLDLLLLVAYAFFFLAQMSLGAKKMPRYVLPSILALDIVAAAGIVAWARALAGGRRRWAAALMAFPLLIQAALVLPRHPYYGTALNWIAGGPPAAARAILIGEEGEGLADLAAYLNERPDAERLTVAAQLKHVFNQTFRGTTVDIDEPADYLVFHRNYTVRDYKVEQWGDLWERYAPRTPEQEVAFDGVPYAWLYPVLPPDAPPERPVQVRLGTGFRFLGYDLRTTEAAPGDRVPFVLYWQATEPVTADLSIFVHLLAPSGDLVWQDDGAAAHGTRPTWSWAVGETIVDPHTIQLPADLREGDYLLTAGLYDWQTGERLPAFDPGGARLAGDRIEVARLTVRRPRTYPVAWIARGLAGLVLTSAFFTTWRKG